MILLCFSYLLAHTVVSKVRGLLNLIICKSWGCCNSFPAKQGFTIVIYSKTSMYHIYMCTSGHTYHTHVFVSQIHSALTLAQMAQMASSHSTQCLIMRKVWQWESSMDTPGCTCTCVTWIPSETGLIPLICPLAFHGSKSSQFLHLDKWATETPGSLQLLVQTSRTFTLTLIPVADIQTHRNTPKLKIEGNKRADKTVLTTGYDQMYAEQLATCLHVPFIV